MKCSLPTLDTLVEDRPDVLTIPETSGPDSTGSNYRVIIYNDDFTPMDVVVEALMKACEIGKIKAAKIMLEAHRKGRAVCYRGTREKCQKCVKILREVRLQCEVDCD